MIEVRIFAFFRSGWWGRFFLTPFDLRSLCFADSLKNFISELVAGSTDFVKHLFQAQYCSVHACFVYVNSKAATCEQDFPNLMK
jgi:hypothetical protein